MSNIASSILQNPQLLEDVYNTATNSAGSAQKELNSYLDSVDGKLNVLSNRWAEVWSNLISSDLIKGIVDLGSELVKILNWADGLPTKFLAVNAAILTIGATLKTLKSTKYAENFFAIMNSLNPKNMVDSTVSWFKNMTKYGAMLGGEFDAGENPIFNRENGVLTADPEDYSKTVDNYAKSLEGLNNQKKINVISSANLNEEDAKAIATSAGLEAEEIALITTREADIVATEAETVAQEKQNLTFKQAAKNVGNFIKGSAMSFLTSPTAIMIGITAAIAIMHKLSKATEEARENAEKLSSEMENFRKEIGKNYTKLQQLQSEYDKLSKGVDATGNNLSLTTDEYSRYKEVIGEISSILPGLTTYWNEQGEAVKIVGENLKDLTKEQQKYVQEQAKEFVTKGKDGASPTSIFANWSNATNDSFRKENGIPNQLWKLVSGIYKKDVSDTKTKLNGYDKAEKLEFYFNEIQSGKISGYYDRPKGGQPVFPSKNRVDLTKYNDSNAEDILLYLETLGWNKEWNKMSVDEQEALRTSVLNQIDQAKKEAEESAKQIKEYMSNFAYSDGKYWNLNDDNRNALQKTISSLSAQTLESMEIHTQSDANTLVEGWISKFANVDILNAYNSLSDLVTKQSGTLSADDIVAQAKEARDKICNALGIDSEDDRNRFLIQFGVDTETIQASKEHLKKLFKDGIGDARIDELTLEELNIAQGLQFEDGAIESVEQFNTELAKLQDTAKYTIPTLDELKTKMDELQSNFGNLKGAYETVTSAIQEFNRTGGYSIDTFEKLMTIDPKYMTLFLDDDGNITQNTEKIKENTKAYMDNLTVLQMQRVMKEVLSKTNEQDKLDYLNGIIKNDTEEGLDVMDKYIKQFKDMGESDEVIDGLRQAFDTFININSNAINELNRNGFGTDARNQAISEYTSNLNTLSEALQKIKDGELSSSDKIELFEKFPDLANKTDDLDNAIYTLVNKELNDLYNVFGENIPDSLRKELEKLTKESLEVCSSLKKLTEEIDEIQNAYTTSKEAIQEYNKYGMLSLDTVEKLFSLDSQYFNLLIDGNGNLNLTTEALKKLTQARIDEMYIARLREIVEDVEQNGDEAKSVQLLTSETNNLVEAQEQEFIARLRNANASEQTIQNKLKEIEATKQLYNATKKSANLDLDFTLTGQYNGDGIADTLKEQALNNLKYAIDKVKESLQETTDEIDLINGELELTFDEDYLTKIELTADKLSLVQEQGQALREEFERLSQIEPTTAGEAQELQSRMEELGEQIKQNVKDSKDLAVELVQLRMDMVTSLSSQVVDKYKRNLNMISNSIKALGGESLSGLNFDITPHVSKDVVERQKQINKKLIAEEKKFQKEIWKIRKKYIDLNKKEQDTNTAKTMSGYGTAINGGYMNVGGYVGTYSPSYSGSGNSGGSGGYSGSGNDVSNYANATSELPKAVKDLSDGSSRKKVAEDAAKYLGNPYVWGGKSPETSFDCSGLVYYAYKEVFGIDIGEGTSTQWDERPDIQKFDGKKLKKEDGSIDESKLRVGDLLYYSNNGNSNGIHHVTMYVGDGKAIEAPQTGDVIKYSDINTQHRLNEFYGVMRPITDEAEQKAIDEYLKQHPQQTSPNKPSSAKIPEPPKQAADDTSDKQNLQNPKKNIIDIIGYKPSLFHDGFDKGYSNYLFGEEGVVLGENSIGNFNQKRTFKTDGSVSGWVEEAVINLDKSDLKEALEETGFVSLFESGSSVVDAGDKTHDFIKQNKIILNRFVDVLTDEQKDLLSGVDDIYSLLKSNDSLTYAVGRSDGKFEVVTDVDRIETLMENELQNADSNLDSYDGRLLLISERTWEGVNEIPSYEDFNDYVGEGKHDFFDISDYNKPNVILNSGYGSILSNYATDGKLTLGSNPTSDWALSRISSIINGTKKDPFANVGESLVDYKKNHPNEFDKDGKYIGENKLWMRYSPGRFYGKQWLSGVADFQNPEFPFGDFINQYDLTDDNTRVIFGKDNIDNFRKFFEGTEDLIMTSDLYLDKINSQKKNIQEIAENALKKAEEGKTPILTREDYIQTVGNPDIKFPEKNLIYDKKTKTFYRNFKADGDGGWQDNPNFFPENGFRFGADHMTPYYLSSYNEYGRENARKGETNPVISPTQQPEEKKGLFGKIGDLIGTPVEAAELPDTLDNMALDNENANKTQEKTSNTIKDNVEQITGWIKDVVKNIKESSKKSEKNSTDVTKSHAAKEASGADTVIGGNTGNSSKFNTTSNGSKKTITSNGKTTSSSGKSTVNTGSKTQSSSNSKTSQTTNKTLPPSTKTNSSTNYSATYHQTTFNVTPKATTTTTKTTTSSNSKNTSSKSSVGQKIANGAKAVGNFIKNIFKAEGTDENGVPFTGNYVVGEEGVEGGILPDGRAIELHRGMVNLPEGTQILTAEQYADVKKYEGKFIGQKIPHYATGTGLTVSNSTYDKYKDKSEGYLGSLLTITAQKDKKDEVTEAQKKELLKKIETNTTEIYKKTEKYTDNQETFNKMTEYLNSIAISMAKTDDKYSYDKTIDTLYSITDNTDEVTAYEIKKEIADLINRRPNMDEKAFADLVANTVKNRLDIIKNDKIYEKYREEQSLKTQSEDRRDARYQTKLDMYLQEYRDKIEKSTIEENKRWTELQKSKLPIIETAHNGLEQIRKNGGTTKATAYRETLYKEVNSSTTKLLKDTMQWNKDNIGRQYKEQRGLLDELYKYFDELAKDPNTTSDELNVVKNTIGEVQQSLSELSDVYVEAAEQFSDFTIKNAEHMALKFNAVNNNLDKLLDEQERIIERTASATDKYNAYLKTFELNSKKANNRIDEREFYRNQRLEFQKELEKNPYYEELFSTFDIDAWFDDKNQETDRYYADLQTLASSELVTTGAVDLNKLVYEPVKAWKTAWQEAFEEWMNADNAAYDAENKAKDLLVETFLKAKQAAADLYNFEYEKQKTIIDGLSAEYDLRQQIRTSISEANKELRANKELEQWLDPETRKLIFNDDDYKDIINKYNSINEAIETDYKAYQAKLSKLDVNDWYQQERLTAEYNRQLEIHKENLEIAQKQLAVAKKQAEYDNRARERDTQIILGNRVVNVADPNEMHQLAMEKTELEEDLENTRLRNVENQDIRDKTAEAEIIKEKADELTNLIEIWQKKSIENQRIMSDYLQDISFYESEIAALDTTNRYMLTYDYGTEDITELHGYENMGFYSGAEYSIDHKALTNDLGEQLKRGEISQEQYNSRVKPTNLKRNVKTVTHSAFGQYAQEGDERFDYSAAIPPREQGIANRTLADRIAQGTIEAISQDAFEYINSFGEIDANVKMPDLLNKSYVEHKNTANNNTYNFGDIIMPDTVKDADTFVKELSQQLRQTMANTNNISVN